MNDSLFEVEHLSLAYPGRRGQPAAPILKDVSFTVERGRALTLVGPSGSGKSSLLRCLNRLEEPTAGTVRFDGRDIRDLDPRRLRRGAALVMQTPVVFEGTVRDNLRIRPADVDGDQSEARLGQALADVGLAGELLDRDAATLSGGEKQRVTIARALLGDPRALLLHAPTSALDPPNAALVVETVSRLRETRGLSIVAVTHQPELVRRLGGMLLYLVKGETQAYERVGDLDVRLQAFLAGERAAGVGDASWARASSISRFRSSLWRCSWWPRSRSSRSDRRWAWSAISCSAPSGRSCSSTGSASSLPPSSPRRAGTGWCSSSS